MTLAEAAVLYAQKRSWHVFPLQAQDKRPIPGSNGFHDATNDPGIIAEWWDANPDHNIGIATGPASGLWILDVDPDPPKGGGLTGPAALDILEARHGALPPTRTCITGSGGAHYYYRWPEGRDCRNRQGIRIDGQLAALDVRADGGYVVAPPSIHPDTKKAYRWAEGHMDIAEAPAWLLDLFYPAKPTTTAQQVHIPASGDPARRYGERALQGACDDIIAAANRGESRHKAIYVAAASMGELIGGGVLFEEEVIAALTSAGEATGKDHREVARTVTDGIAKGKQSPRRPEPRKTRLEPWVGGPPEWMEEVPVPDDLGEPAPDSAAFTEAPPPAPEDAPADVAPSGYRLTDLGNARRLVAHMRGSYRWCKRMIDEGWMCWDGTRWVPDDTLAVLSEAKKIPAVIRRAAWNLSDDDERDAYLKHADKSESLNSLRAMVTLACSEPGVVSRQSEYDADHFLFATPTKTLNLRTATAYDPRREDMITRRGNVGFGAGSIECPTWLRFMDEITSGDRTLHAYLQRVAGYCMTGSTDEQCLFIAHGNGANGKGTFVETLRYIMGGYARTTQIETFVGRKQGQIPNDLAALVGVRMVTCSEPEDGVAFSEGLVKLVTGQDTITARFLNREFFDYQPTWKIMLLCNPKPVIRGVDNGIWRRIHLIPFEVTIPPERRDKNLKQKLLAEAPGILHWMLNGCAEWQRVGLAPPDAVVAATKSYRQEMDILSNFLEERCETSPDSRVGNTDLYKAFCAWCEDVGEHKRPQRWLTRQLFNRGFKQSRDASARRWDGLGLRDGVASTPRFGWSSAEA